MVDEVGGDFSSASSDTPAIIALMAKNPSVPKNRVPGAAPTASSLQVRCDRRLRLHRCEPRHERLQMSFFLFLSYCSPHLPRNSLTRTAPFF